jgi:hypothetical protein
LTLRAFEQRENELSQSWVRALYLEFAKINSEHKRYKRLKDHVDKQIGFFRLLDKRCSSEDEINLYKLFSVFGAKWEKKYPHICSYLIRIDKIPALDDVLHDEYKSFFLQQALLEKGFGKWFHALLMEFYKHQQELLRRYRERGWTDKSIRYRQSSVLTSLKAALRFLTFIEHKIGAAHDINQSLFDEFLYTHPGYHNVIRTFVRFLRKKRFTNHKIKIQMKKGATLPNNEVDSDKYINVLHKCLHPEPGKARVAVITLFAMIYAQRPKQIRMLKLSDVIEESEGCYAVMFNEIPIPMDEEVNPVIKQYLEERKISKINRDIPNEFLFPGRHAKSPLGELSVAYMLLNEAGVGTRQAFPTALLQKYRAGLQCPAILKFALGICGATAVAYSKEANIRVRNELNEFRQNK